MTGPADLYGLRVRSEVPLLQDRPATGPDRPTDLTVTLLPPAACPADLPAGELLLDAVERDTRRYAAVRRPDGSYVLRFLRTGEVILSADLSRATYQPYVGAPAGMAQVMITGSLMAFVLTLRGHLVLHASAVDVGGEAVGFVGHSGMGKSTMAAMMCAAGAAIVTDDVLRVDLAAAAAAPRVRLGSSELRLRKGADTLAAEFVGTAPGRRRSADQREVLSLADDAGDDLSLRALLIPHPVRGAIEPRFDRLSPKGALFALLGFPRLLGWLDPTVNRRHFEQVSTLVEQVPVLVATVPWGPPFRADLAERIRAAASSMSPADA